MLAIKLALKCFEHNIRQQNVKFKVDDMTVLSVLNNMSTSHSWELNELNKNIWSWCIHRGTWLTVAHISSKSNTVTDRESRQHHREIEWTLNQELYEEGICELSVTPDIDHFASRLNLNLMSSAFVCHYHRTNAVQDAECLTAHCTQYWDLLTSTRESFYMEKILGS